MAAELLDIATMTQVKVALVSDTHGMLDVRIQHLVTQCDLAVHGGDIGCATVLAQLQPRLGRVLAVFGNNDVAQKWPEADRRLLEHVPEWFAQPLPGGQLVAIHGHQLLARDRHQSLRGRFPQARAIVYGHSHHLVVDVSASPWVLNPGAAGRIRTHGGPSCLVLTATPTTWQIETYRYAPAPLNPRLSYYANLIPPC